MPIDLTPRWKGTGQPIKPGLFALMILLPFILGSALMAWMFNETAGMTKKATSPAPPHGKAKTPNR